MGAITPSELSSLEYDKIIVTSSKYYDEIYESLVQEYDVDKNKIFSKEDVFGDFRNSYVRDMWVIDKLLGIPDGAVILDAGAGEQKYKQYCQHLKYIAQDFGEYIPQGNPSGLHSDKWDYSGLDLKCDIIDIPLHDNSVDVILCTEVLEHIKNPILAIKEFARLLKPNGKLLLTAPFCCLTHMAPFFFYNGFSEYWYDVHLKDYGFENILIKRYGNFFAWLQQELVRLNEMGERYSYGGMSSEDLKTIFDAIQILRGFSERDRGSDETLCFGMMVEATKI